LKKEPPFFDMGAQSREDRERRAPYYPDPAASFLVLRLKRLGSDADWLDEPPLVVPLHGQGLGTWPDPLPVHIELRAGPDRNLADTQGNARARLIQLEPSPIRYLTQNGGWTDGSPSDGIAVRSIVITLAPGEQAGLAAWLVPTVDQLEQWFDLCRSMSTLAEAEGKAEAPDRSKQAACSIGLERLI